MKTFFAIALTVLFAAFSAASCIYLDLASYSREGVFPGEEKTLVAILPGQPLHRTAAMLRDAGIIDHPRKFRWFARIWGYDRKIRAGEYQLSSPMPPADVLDTLMKGKVYLRRVTIPEGYNLYQIADLVEQAGLASKDAFIRAATDPALAGRQGIAADTVEGYLFPETYFFPRKVAPERMVAAMIQRFWFSFTPKCKQRADALGLSIHQLVTLASIVEKETGADQERFLVSSVFHNRMKRGMRLESDPTVIYGIRDFDGNITRVHLTSWSPYNTYLIEGLPPGPIANPGIRSIEAALFPAETPYLFFVSRKDNTHQFSTSLEEHNRAVRKYQLSK